MKTMSRHDAIQKLHVLQASLERQIEELNRLKPTIPGLINEAQTGLRQQIQAIDVAVKAIGALRP